MFHPSVISVRGRGPEGEPLGVRGDSTATPHGEGLKENEEIENAEVEENLTPPNSFVPRKTYATEKGE